MKTFAAIILSVFLFTACSNQSSNTELADTATAIKEMTDTVADTLCFQRTEGLKNQDTASVQLVITGNEVTGSMINKPAEKDSRKGALQAARQGNIIKGLWLYMQEGVQDTLSVEFSLKGDTLMQKGYTYNKQTGREQLSHTSGYTIRFLKIDCVKLPK